jgi:hypothetical protein
MQLFQMGSLRTSPDQSESISFILDLFEFLIIISQINDPKYFAETKKYCSRNKLPHVLASPIRNNVDNCSVRMSAVSAVG